MSPYSLIRPPALREGDCIGLAAPASPIKRELFFEGVEIIQSLGFRVHYTPRIFDVKRYLAGADSDRAAELHDLFINPDIQAIFCCRGGYGSQRLIAHLNPAIIIAHPKIFLGYSDLTSLLLYFYSRCRLVTFHGPAVAGDLHRGIEDAVLRQLKGVLTGDEAVMQAPDHHPASLTVIRPGEAAGRLIGGCLSLFVCSIGTPFQPDLHDTILFLEDRNERFYAIDRMLTYLKLCGAFEGVRGIVFGRIDPMPADRDHPYDVVDVIADVLSDLNIPILYGFPAGHCPQALTLPFGVEAAIRENRLVLSALAVVQSANAH
ncbi:MAG: LD-carboxypeptidase [Candidatus Tectomicrobia bacterium]|nr:LD-carboxypeptidase [Candidatus Tectomicrobia bacterium]